METTTLAQRNSDTEDEEMAAKFAKEVTEKLHFILSRLDNLDTKMEDLNQAVKSLQSKVSSLEVDVSVVKDTQKSFNEKCMHFENATFVDKHIQELQSGMDKRKEEISNNYKQMLYFEVYSRRENLKFEGIPETPESLDLQREDTRQVLGIEDAQDIEFQRVHRMGKRKLIEGNSCRMIIARFLRFPDRERVLKHGRKLKDTSYKMYEDIPRELHDLRKLQMKRLNKAREEGKHANFSKSQPDKLYIDGKYDGFF